MVLHSAANALAAASPHGPSTARRIDAAALAAAAASDARAGSERPSRLAARRESNHAEHRRAPTGRPGSSRAKPAASASHISARARDADSDSDSVSVPVSFSGTAANPTSRSAAASAEVGCSAAACARLTAAAVAAAATGAPSAPASARTENARRALATRRPPGSAGPFDSKPNRSAATRASVDLRRHETAKRDTAKSAVVGDVWGGPASLRGTAPESDCVDGESRATPRAEASRGAETKRPGATDPRSVGATSPFQSSVSTRSASDSPFASGGSGSPAASSTKLSKSPSSATRLARSRAPGASGSANSVASVSAATVAPAASTARGTHFPHGLGEHRNWRTLASVTAKQLSVMVRDAARTMDSWCDRKRAPAAKSGNAAATASERSPAAFPPCLVSVPVKKNICTVLALSRMDVVLSSETYRPSTSSSSKSRFASTRRFGTCPSLNRKNKDVSSRMFCTTMARVCRSCSAMSRSGLPPPGGLMNFVKCAMTRCSMNASKKLGSCWSP